MTNKHFLTPAQYEMALKLPLFIPLPAARIGRIDVLRRLVKKGLAEERRATGLNGTGTAYIGTYIAFQLQIAVRMETERHEQHMRSPRQGHIDRSA